MTDAEVRIAAFEWLRKQVDQLGDILPRDLLLKGFDLGGVRVPLLSPQQGIFKPKVLPLMPLSIMTAPEGPYDDSLDEQGHLWYRYRGTDPNHRDNVGLREAMRRRAPLVYLYKLIRGRYCPAWPVFVVEDDPGGLTFRISVDDASLARKAAEDTEAMTRVLSEDSAPRRAYVTTVFRRRLHQASFRERVLEAYKATCALCRLRHRELLEAAHIIPDSEPGGEPQIRNGIALCKLHHAVFDQYIIGVCPDYEVHVRPAILKEKDGPMLVHGLQGLHGSKLCVPRDPSLKPGREQLEWRWKRFVAVA